MDLFRTLCNSIRSAIVKGPVVRLLYVRALIYISYWRTAAGSEHENCSWLPSCIKIWSQMRYEIEAMHHQSLPIANPEFERSKPRDKVVLSDCESYFDFGQDEDFSASWLERAESLCHNGTSLTE